MRKIFKPGPIAERLERLCRLERAYPDVVTLNFHPMTSETDPGVLATMVVNEMKRYFEDEGAIFTEEKCKYVSKHGIMISFCVFRDDGIEYDGLVMSGHLAGATLPIVSVTWYEVADMPQAIYDLIEELPEDKTRWEEFLLDLVPGASAHRPSHISPSRSGGQFGIRFTNSLGRNAFAAFWDDGSAVLYEEVVGNAEIHGTWRRIVMEVLRRADRIWM
ncbi:MAG: hypothetical protein HGA38_03405 [Candidatus Moranbacteria bacterium]|nr:hypothetical protein [Candidatus Moranbacteria bacterium]